MILSHCGWPSVTAHESMLDRHLTPPSKSATDSAWLPHKGDRTLMENTQDELKAHLMNSDEEFRHLAEQHAQYHKQLEALEAKPHLTSEEELEEHRLKKLKLHLKDQMNGLMARHRAEHVA
jgi:uncharacterized protein YdcH (DUF465 family)